MNFFTLLFILLLYPVLSAQTSSDGIILSEDSLLFKTPYDTVSFWIHNKGDSTVYVDSLKSLGPMSYEVGFGKDTVIYDVVLFEHYPDYWDTWEKRPEILAGDSIQSRFLVRDFCAICKEVRFSDLFEDSLLIKFFYKDGDSTNLYFEKSFKLYGDFPSSVEEDYFPVKFELFQNYPNPFNPSTTIEFNVNELSVININLFDVLGKNIGTVLNKELPAGRHTVFIDAGKYKLSSGVYFVQMSALKEGATLFSANRKIIFLK